MFKWNLITFYLQCGCILNVLFHHPSFALLPSCQILIGNLINMNPLRIPLLYFSKVFRFNAHNMLTRNASQPRAASGFRSSGLGSVLKLSTRTHKCDRQTVLGSVISTTK